MIDTTYLSQNEMNDLQPKKHACEFCDVATAEDDLYNFEGYKVCEECYDNAEQQLVASEEPDVIELAERVGFNDACMKIYDMIQSGEIKAPIDILYLVKLR
jgi:hypothetical protein